MAEKKNQVAKATATDQNAERYRMRAQYQNEVVPALVKHFGYKNINEVPRLEKIVLNMGLGDCKDNSKSLNIAVEELKQIAGQKPVITTAKKSVANFKVREGMNVGAKVTLRGERMYDFLDKFISIALPRVREETTPSASRNSSFSRKSLTTKSRKCADSTSASSPPQRRTRKHASCSDCWVCLLRSKEIDLWPKLQ